MKIKLTEKSKQLIAFFVIIVAIFVLGSYVNYLDYKSAYGQHFFSWVLYNHAPILVMGAIIVILGLIVLLELFKPIETQTAR